MRRKLKAKSRGDEQKPDMRRDAFGASGHVTTKPSICKLGRNAGMHGAVLGLVMVVHMADTPEMARGELMRFFAEAAWYPTALLPSQGVAGRRWTTAQPTPRSPTGR